MNKTISFLRKSSYIMLTALFCVGTSVAFTACNEDDPVENGGGNGGNGGSNTDGNGSSNSDLVKNGWLLEGADHWSFSYDSKNRCTSVKEYYSSDDNGTYTIDYKTGKITNSDPNDQETFIATFNSRGYISGGKLTTRYEDEYDGSVENATVNVTFKYNDAGQLTSWNASYSGSYTEDGEKSTFKGTDVTTLTWRAGNLIKVTDQWSETEDGETDKGSDVYEITYGEEPNINRMYTAALTDAFEFPMECGDALMYVGLFGKGTQELPTSVNFVWNEDNGESGGDTYEAEYILNAYGSIIMENYCGRSIYYSYTRTGGDEPDEANPGTTFTPSTTKAQKAAVPMRSFWQKHRARRAARK